MGGQQLPESCFKSHQMIVHLQLAAASQASGSALPESFLSRQSLRRVGPFHCMAERLYTDPAKNGINKINGLIGRRGLLKNPGMGGKMQVTTTKGKSLKHARRDLWNVR